MGCNTFQITNDPVITSKVQYNKRNALKADRNVSPSKPVILRLFIKIIPTCLINNATIVLYRPAIAMHRCHTCIFTRNSGYGTVDESNGTAIFRSTIYDYDMRVCIHI